MTVVVMIKLNLDVSLQSEYEGPTSSIVVGNFVKQTINQNISVISALYWSGV